jgi:hypothetical protein
MSFIENIGNKTHEALIRFLKGETNKSGYETIKEFKRETENTWEDLYSLGTGQIRTSFYEKDQLVDFNTNK